MGRKPIGEKKLSNDEKQKRYQERNNSAERKLKDQLWNRSNVEIFIKIHKNIRSI